MIDNEGIFDVATLLVLLASLFAGLAAGLPLRLVSVRKDAKVRFSLSLFFLVLSAFFACAAAAFVLLSRLGGLFPYFYIYCLAGFLSGALSALFPRSAGISVLLAVATLSFISVASTASLTPLKPGVSVGWLYVQDTQPGKASVNFKDDSGSIARVLAVSSLAIEAETLLVKGPLGILAGRRHYRFVTFREPAGNGGQGRLLTRFMLRLLGFTFGTAKTAGLRLQYLSGYVFSFDADMNLRASAL